MLERPLLGAHILSNQLGSRNLWERINQPGGKSAWDPLPPEHSFVLFFHEINLGTWPLLPITQWQVSVSSSLIPLLAMNYWDDTIFLLEIHRFPFPKGFLCKRVATTTTSRDAPETPRELCLKENFSRNSMEYWEKVGLGNQRDLSSNPDQLYVT